LFLAAAARIRRAKPDAHFLVIGDGVQRPRLETLRDRLNLTNAVHFLGTRGDVAELLSLVDVLMLTSHMEANPVSILEALACGIPVVATRVGSIPESVHDGENGYLVSPGDEEGLAARVVELFNAPDLARRFGLAGRQAVTDRWSVERMVSGYEELIEGIYASKVTTLLNR
jgi:glycosyltransferase involved in cell wall biosynthesis